MSFTNIYMPDSVPWSYLFDYSWYSRLRYFEWPLCGYPTKITVEPHFEIKPFKKANLKIYLQSRIAMASFNKLPISIEDIGGVRWKLHRFLVNYELRSYRLKSEFLEADFEYDDHYAEISYQTTPHATIRISYGLRPIDLNNDYRARKEFLKTHGVTEFLLRTGFHRLGKAMQRAERDLSRINEITLWGELTF